MAWKQTESAKTVKAQVTFVFWIEKHFEKDRF